MGDADVFNQATEFMLSMKAKYHGERLADTGDTIARILGTALGRLDPSEETGG
jgi:hypothetical protein